MKENNEIKNPTKTDFKLIFAIIFFITLIISLANKFITLYIPENITSILMFEVKGAKIVIISAQFYLYSIIAKKKNIYLISILAMFLGFGYTLYSLNDFNYILNNETTVLKDFIKYDIGLYLYIASFILLVIDICIPHDSFKIYYKKTSSIDKNNIDEEYILANFIYGLYKRLDLYNKVCAIVSKREENNLHIFIESTDKIVINIANANIVAINIKSRYVMNEEKKEMETNDTADMLLLTSLFGTWGTFAYQYQNDFSERLNIYHKINFNKIYEIEIIYTTENISYKLIMKSKCKCQHQNLRKCQS